MDAPRFVCAFVCLALAGVSCSGDDDQAAPVDTGSSENAASDAVEVHDDWGDVFDEADAVGTFALREVGSGVTMVWNDDRAAEPRLPASTFKILNSLIVLETGVLQDTETVVRWDGVERDVAAWNQDHSLRTGIEVSAVWMYQELARQIGTERMQEWVTRAGYGNADIDGGIDQFWLQGDLRISPLEQLDFLEALIQGELPFSEDAVDAVLDILVRERGSDWIWAHKTGTATADDPDLGWLVGFTEFDDRQHVFAMNLDLGDGQAIDTQVDPQLRQEVAREILGREGALPES